MGNHYRLRKETTDYMCEHKDDFQPFVEDNVSFEKHSKILYLNLNFSQSTIIIFLNGSWGAESARHLCWK